MLRKNKHIFSGIKHMTIARKITLLYSGIFSASLLCISLFMALNISAIQQHAIRRELNHTIYNIKNHMVQGKSLSNESLKALLDNKYVEVSVYCQKDGNHYYSYLGGDIPSFIQSPSKALRETQGGAITDVLQESEEMRRRDLEKDGFRITVQKADGADSVEYILENSANQQFMLISTIVPVGEKTYHIEAFKLVDVNSSLIKSFAVKLVTLDAMGILCAFMIGKYISYRMLRPVDAIRAAAERITIEDLSRRIDLDGPEDEMKELAVTFNSMIDRLEASFQRQNQFVSDASHELRTPISVIQGYANLINRWGKSDPEILQEAIDSILSETEHMSALIRKLLFLAKSDQNRMQIQKQCISFNEIAGEVVRELEVMEVQRCIRLEEEATAEIWADPDLIKQLLWIHAENALKYTTEGGKITLRVWKDAEFAYVSVSDDGMGIAEEDMSKIFDRFYRVDKSRSKEISGTGLGLSIARWIIDSHDGKVYVESECGRGSTFINRFRLYREDVKKEKKTSVTKPVNETKKD